MIFPSSGAITLQNLCNLHLRCGTGSLGLSLTDAADPLVGYHLAAARRPALVPQLVGDV